MKIIKITANENGSRPAPQEWRRDSLPSGYAWCPDEFVSVFYSTSPAGFVDIKVEADNVTEMTVNGVALAEYIATHPEPEPKPDPEPEETIYDELAAAYIEGVNSID